MTTDAKDEQGLEKTIAKTPDVITTPEEFNACQALWAQRKYHVLTPFTNLSGLAPQHGIMASVVQLDPNPQNGEVYSGGQQPDGSRGVPWLKPNEVAIAKIGLRKLAECAGVSYTTNRTDGHRWQFYWEFKAVVSYRGVDGSIITREATKEWDLRDGSPQLTGWTASQISEGRKHGLRNCEARAINAAIREAGCGIKQKYTKDELAMPFVVLRVAFRANMDDPDQKRMVLERALGSTAQLYPHAQPPARLASAGGDGGDDGGETFAPSEPRSVGRGSTQQAPAADQKPEPKAEPKADVAPPSVDAVKILDVKKRPNQTAIGGSQWDITFATQQGEQRSYSTFSSSVADDAIEARDAKAWVDLTTTTKGQYTNITAIEKPQPSLLPGQGDL